MRAMAVYPLNVREPEMSVGSVRNRSGAPKSKVPEVEREQKSRSRRAQAAVAGDGRGDQAMGGGVGGRHVQVTSNIQALRSDIKDLFPTALSTPFSNKRLIGETHRRRRAENRFRRGFDQVSTGFAQVAPRFVGTTP